MTHINIFHFSFLFLAINYFSYPDVPQAEAKACRVKFIDQMKAKVSRLFWSISKLLLFVNFNAI